MPVRTQPIFAGKPDNTPQTFSSASATTKVIYTANATDGSIVKAINAYFASSVAVDLTIRTTIGGTQVTLANIAFTPSAKQAINILQNLYLKFIDDADPVWVLEPGQTIEITTTSFASTVDIMVVGAPLN